jgi:hypothetical protein
MRWAQVLKSFGSGRLTRLQSELKLYQAGYGEKGCSMGLFFSRPIMVADAWPCCVCAGMSLMISCLATEDDGCGWAG